MTTEDEMNGTAQPTEDYDAEFWAAVGASSDDDAPPPEEAPSRTRRTRAKASAEESPPPKSADFEADRSAWGQRVQSVPAEWFTTAPPKRRWFLRDARTRLSDGVLPLGKVGLLVAEGGGGKTMALAQLAVATATGTRWLGALDVVASGRVLLILGEEDAEEVRRRVHHAAGAVGCPRPPDDSIVALPLAGVLSEMICHDPHGNPIDAEFLAWLRRYLAASEGWRLIIVDPLSRFAGLDAEKDNARATRFIEALESLAAQVDATVLCAHHTPKVNRGVGAAGGPPTGRGVTALSDGARWVAALTVERVSGLEGEAAERLGEVVTVAVTKTNYARAPSPVRLRRDFEHGGALVPLDDTDAEMIEAARKHGEPAARKATAKEDERRARFSRADETVVAIVAERPGIGARDLRAAVELALAIGKDAAGDAIDRAVASGRVRRRVEGKNRHTHYTAEGS